MNYIAHSVEDGRDFVEGRFSECFDGVYAGGNDRWAEDVQVRLEEDAADVRVVW